MVFKLKIINLFELKNFNFNGLRYFIRFIYYNK